MIDYYLLYGLNSNLKLKEALKKCAGKMLVVVVFCVSVFFSKEMIDLSESKWKSINEM